MNAALVRTLAEAEVNTDTITPGVLGFIIVALVGLALYLLMKSMVRKLGRVRGAAYSDDGTDGREDGTGGPETGDNGDETTGRG